jgi:metallo-beta-lactamase family protein
MKISTKFLGGAVSDNFTGSATLIRIELGKKILRILIDAGLIQSSFGEMQEKNLNLAEKIEAEKLDYIIITHSHIDHIGLLPLLLKKQFKGRIICTEAAALLMEPMLKDSAKIQSLEAAYSQHKEEKMEKKRQSYFSKDRLLLGKYDKRRNKNKNGKKNNSHNQAVYTMEDIPAVLEAIKNSGMPYQNWLKLSHEVHCKFYPSGHVIGGGIVVIRIKNRQEEKYLAFSGDLGREDGLILPPPEIVEEKLERFIIESTYGGRFHPSRKQELKHLADIIKATQKTKGKIIIPSFALERTQEMIYLLSMMMEKKEIPETTIFLDSPLAAEITAKFSSFWEEGMFSDQNNCPFNPFNPNSNRFLKIINSQEESDKMIASPDRFLIIAGSGMANAGRVRGWLRKLLPKSNTQVCLIGFMAENTLGQKLSEKPLFVMMNDQKITVKAKINSFESFSAHADKGHLVSYIRKLAEKNEKIKIFINHGNQESAKSLSESLKNFLSDKQIIITENNKDYL